MKLKLYLNNNLWPFYLFWLCFFPPQLLELIIPHSKMILYSLQFVTIVFMVVVLKTSRKKIIFSFYEVTLICLCLYGGIICILFSVDMIKEYVVNYIWPIMSVSLGILFLSMINKDMLVASLKKYFVLLLYLNAFSMLLFPNGVVVSNYGASIMRSFWVLGSKNVISKAMPLYFLAITLLYMDSKTIGSITMLMCVFVVSSMGSGGVELLSGSTTALVMSIVYFALILLLISNNKYILKVLSVFKPVNIALLSGILSYVCYQISQGKIKIVNEVLLLLGKDYTFSYRNTVWKAMTLLINEHFLWGVGFQNLRLPLANIYTNQCYSFWGAILVKMGIGGILLWVLVFLFAYRHCIFNYYVGGAFIALIMLMLYSLMNDFKLEYLIILLSLIRTFGIPQELTD